LNGISTYAADCIVSDVDMPPMFLSFCRSQHEDELVMIQQLVNW